ncbi:hypothetical protein GCM10027418_24720 [Mariniluteicoccus endophyticus]
MTPLQWVLGTWAFLAELGFGAGLAYVGWRLGRGVHPAVGALTAAIALVGGIAMWATWFSPDADRRLVLWPRVAAASVLMVATGGGVAALGRPRWGLALAVAGSLAMVVAQPALEA